MRALSLCLVLLPALALADTPVFDTSVSVRLDDDHKELDAAFDAALRSHSGHALDGCWHKAGRLRAEVGLDDGKVTSVEIIRSDDNGAKACVTRVLTTISLGGATGHSVVAIELEAVQTGKMALLADDLHNRKVLDALLDKNLTTNLSKFRGIEAGGVGIGTGTGVGPGAGGGGTGTAVDAGASKVAVGPIDAPPADGDLSAAVIDRVFRARAGIFRACYQKELARDPKLTGKVVIRLAIKPDGSTANVQVASTTLKSAAVEKCLIAQIERLKFPAGFAATVNYPFVFTQGG